MGHRIGKLVPFSVFLVAVVAAGAAVADAGSSAARHRPPGRGGGVDLEVQSLDGSGNNRAHPRWGRAGLPYSRVAQARYADGRGVRRRARPDRAARGAVRRTAFALGRATRQSRAPRRPGERTAAVLRPAPTKGISP